MTRNGKISRLPEALREELNRRLENGIPGREIVGWLNDHPDAKEVLRHSFGGRPVNEQNLSEWRRGGYAGWQLRRDLLADAGTEDAGALIVSRATRILTTRCAHALYRWNGSAEGSPSVPGGGDPLTALNKLSPLIRPLASARRSDIRSARRKLEQQSSALAAAEQAELRQRRMRASPSPNAQKWSRRMGLRRFTDQTAMDAIQNSTCGLDGDGI